MGPKIPSSNATSEKLKEHQQNFAKSAKEAFEKISNFVINDFSRGYIKITRDREDTKEILKEVLEKVSLLIAPFAPYISEYIYSNFSKISVHLSSFGIHHILFRICGFRFCCTWGMVLFSAGALVPALPCVWGRSCHGSSSLWYLAKAYP
jgi:hypothetical protein